MTVSPQRSAPWAVAAVALSLFIPSTGLIQKYLGLAGLAFYLVAASILLFVAFFLFFPWLCQHLPEGWIRWLSIATLGIVLGLVLVVYPLADSGQLGGGSDSDDALRIAVTSLLSGKYPYAQVTYLGNPISPLPGALLLASPFVMLGNVALQNVFWLAAFLVVSAKVLRDRRQALMMLWTVLVLSPVVSQQLAAGTDYLANTIYVLVFSLLTIRAADSSQRSIWHKVVPAILFGISLSSRANFLLLLPLVVAAIGQRAGWWEALRSVTIAVGSFVVVTLPFYLWNPVEFTPLYTYYEVGRYRDVVPYAGLLVPALSASVAILLALRSNHSVSLFLGHAAFVQAVPVGAAILLASMRSGRVNLAPATFGMFFLFFGVLAAWPAAWEKTAVTKLVSTNRL